MAANKTEQSNNSQAVDNNQKLDAIRNLIFGENIQQYDSEFDLLKKDILKKRKELQDLVDDTRDELMKSIDSLSTDLNIRISDLETKIEEDLSDMDAAKVDRNMLGDALISLAEKIKA
ncbi:fructose 1,6-bisphosphatase [Nonlabens ponticola]|uniref:Fructose 1,6-bisphosphatase n=1 Tax=Nonlabens ponticola TaxID=2496866 RepID=A0A3S9MWG7_9FLAO|nr:fructose 1,6-bisphosphatase [Nonlabens ponticola]AZQ43484.1 fructose 1,6-bisphosphatase [Nonlabens ponticola]